MIHTRTQRKQYEAAYQVARDIATRWGRTVEGHSWGRIILKRFSLILGERDEFAIEFHVNALAFEYVSERNDAIAKTERAHPGFYYKLLMGRLGAFRQYPVGVSRAAIEAYLYPRRTQTKAA